MKGRGSARGGAGQETITNDYTITQENRSFFLPPATGKVNKQSTMAESANQLYEQNSYGKKGRPMDNIKVNSTLTSHSAEKSRGLSQEPPQGEIEDAEK